MHASRAICSICASQTRSAQARPLGGIAWFAALSDAAGPSPPATAQSQETDGRRSEKDGPRAEGGRHRNDYSPRPGFYTKRPPKSTAEESAVALFNDVVKPRFRGTPATTSRPSPLGEWEPSARVKQLTEMNIVAAKKLRIFQTDVWPHLQELRGRISRPLLISTTQFLGRVCDDLVEAGHTGNSLELSQMYSSIGKWELDVRNQLVLNICYALIHGNNTAASYNTLLPELVDMWKHISQLRRRSQEGEALQFALPSPGEVLKDIAAGQRTPHIDSTTRALTAVFLQFLPEQARDLIPGLLATVAVLSDLRLTRPDMQIAMAPLLSLVAAALSKEEATESYISSAFGNRIRFPPSKLLKIQSYVTNQWAVAALMLSKRDATWRSGLAPPSASGPTASAVLNRFHQQLRVAHAARSTGAIVSIWEDLQARLDKYPKLANQMRDQPEFLDYCIFLWCAVQRPVKLQETLNLMQQIGVHLTIKSYTAMMHGWKFCKDSDKVEALWDKLASSGMKLDSYIWTERISSLIEAGKPQAGIQALAQMLFLWKTAGQKNVPHTAAQPTIEVVNAAFKGLVRLDRRAAYEVLEWAGREQIEPNIWTYNILLSESFRSDNPKGVHSILKAMKKQGIDPDAATFTIILEEVLGTMSSASAAEQVQAVQQVLADIESSGLRPNRETYGKMLYAVASLANGADEAIAAVLTHMLDNGLSITPHMVTILIERALSRDPSDKTAITELLREHNFTHIGQGDQTLWERVMSAHAVTGDVARAMSVFNDLAQAGRPVTSLPCLADLLTALLARKQLNDARDIVGVVLEHKAKAREEPRDARYWRHHFWYLARENGLLNWNDMSQELRSSLHG